MMATLPRINKSPAAPSAHELLTRRQSDFDAGINTSNAWTEHLERGSLSDEEPDSDNDDDYSECLPARALYDFDGKVEFRELSVQAGDDIDVVKEELADGWSLVKNGAGEVGLLPRSYYAVNDHPSPSCDHSFLIQCPGRMHILVHIRLCARCRSRDPPF
jgi:sorting nexin-9/18/33